MGVCWFLNADQHAVVASSNGPVKLSVDRGSVWGSLFISESDEQSHFPIWKS